MEPEDYFIDFAKIESVAGESRDALIELIKLFLEFVPKQVDELLMYLEKEDAFQVSETAHKLKPSFDTMGLKALKERALLVEKTAKQDGLSDLVRNKILEIKSGMDKVVLVLKDFLSKEG